jgi:hypothetical protein
MMANPMIIFVPHEGARIDYKTPARPGAVPLHGVLTIEDLNPQVKLQWRVSRGELIKIGLRCLFAASQYGFRDGS